MVFDCVMPVLLLVISFSLGCGTDVTALRQRFKAPRPLMIALVSQFLLIPAVGTYCHNLSTLTDLHECNTTEISVIQI